MRCCGGYTQARVQQTALAASILGDKIYTDFPFLPGATAVDPTDLTQLALNRTWRPTLTVLCGGLV